MPSGFDSFEAFFEAYRTQLNYFIDVKMRGNNVIERLYAAYMPAPFLSLLIDDCIQTGKDYHDGGARYNTSYIQGVGLGTMTDAMTAIKVHVFDRKTVSMAELLAALHADFDGSDRTRQMLLNRTPRYGNDDDEADDLMRARLRSLLCTPSRTGRTRSGGRYHINLLPTTCHVYFGSVCGATPDGRRAYTPLSEGISPVQGADRHGPTAVLKSAAKMDHARTGRHAAQPEIHAPVAERRCRPGYAGAAGPHLLQAGRPSYPVQRGGCRDPARRRNAHPEQYRDLIVRVAGYSDYFCDLGKALQDEIIARTEHQAF